PGDRVRLGVQAQRRAERCLLPYPPARLPTRCVGFPPVVRHRFEDGAGPRLRDAGRTMAGRRKGTGPRLLGWFSGKPGGDRVLAGTGEQAARPIALLKDWRPNPAAPE